MEKALFTINSFTRGRINPLFHKELEIESRDCSYIKKEIKKKIQSPSDLLKSWESYNFSREQCLFHF